MRFPRPVGLLLLLTLPGALAMPAGCGKKRAAPPPVKADPASPPANPRPVIGADVPLTRERLQGTRLDAIQSTTTWDFTETRFTLVNRGNPLPANVAASILGPGSAASRIVGEWRFDGQAGVLILTNIESDDKKVDATVTLPIHGAGAVRANLGTEQYNIFPPEMVRRLER